MSSGNKYNFFSPSPERFAYLENGLKDLLGTFSEDARKIDEISHLLISKYSENHRVYHNLSHVYFLLHEAEECKSGISDYESVRLAIWFHDVIYDPQSKTNEIESAALAVEKLTELNFPNASMEKVERMILATEKHDAAGLDEDGKIFLDLDLGILCASHILYSRYSKAIRKEYSFVPVDLYREKRREVLEAFLQREFIYYTKVRRYYDEAFARENIANEIKELS
jgi:predicted metal-dependent HD superfamily phosphohydrolase